MSTSVDNVEHDPMKEQSSEIADPEMVDVKPTQVDEPSNQVVVAEAGASATTT